MLIVDNGTETRIQISVPESEMKDIFAWHDRSKTAAHTFVEACVKILVEDYGATASWIDRSIFFYSHMGQQVENAISGAEIDDPVMAVSKAVHRCREEYMGLVHPGRRLAIIEENNREIL